MCVPFGQTLSLFDEVLWDQQSNLWLVIDTADDWSAYLLYYRRRFDGGTVKKSVPGQFEV